MPLLVGTRRALLGGRGRTPFARDDFSDVDGVLLQAHAPSGGGSWTRHVFVATGNAVILGNRAANENSAGARFYWHSATPPSADYDVSCDVVLRSDNDASNAGVGGRIDTTDSTLYFARYNTAGNGWQLFKQISGTATELGSTVVQALTVDRAYRLTLALRGSAVRVLVDGAEVIAATDSAITAAGRAGLRVQGVATATTGVHLDNWQAVAA